MARDVVEDPCFPKTSMDRTKIIEHVVEGGEGEESAEFSHPHGASENCELTLIRALDRYEKEIFHIYLN